MQSNWMDKQVSLYRTHSDNIGRPATYRDILLTQFAKDLPVIIALRELDKNADNYKPQAKEYKAQLQCFTPASLLKTKAANKVTEINRPGIMQLDFDYNDIKEYDIEELKRRVFNLPFVAFCGLSCSGYGFYALALIAEPGRLAEYAQHCFEVFKGYGIQPDESKGKKPENLRYLSYDANMLIRENLEPLFIKRFKAKSAIKKGIATTNTDLHFDAGNYLLNKQLKYLNQVAKGSRMTTIQKVAYTLGGLGDKAILTAIKKCIEDNSTFTDNQAAFLKCADECFEAGAKKLL